MSGFAVNVNHLCLFQMKFVYQCQFKLMKFQYIFYNQPHLVENNYSSYLILTFRKDVDPELPDLFQLSEFSPHIHGRSLSPFSRNGSCTRTPCQRGLKPIKSILSMKRLYYLIEDRAIDYLKWIFGYLSMSIEYTAMYFCEPLSNELPQAFFTPA